MSYYPDTASFVVIPDGGINPDTGYPVSGEAETVHLIGRYDAKTSDFIRRAADAESFVPAFVFYMPLGQRNIPEGVILEVQDISSERTYRGKVKMFNKGKFNAYALCANV